MEKYCIIISGHSLNSNIELFNELRKIAMLFKVIDIGLIESKLKEQNVDLIIMESIKHNNYEMEIIKKIRQKYPNIKIIIINGSREFAAQVFGIGVKDIFRKPLNHSLLVERVTGILRSSQIHIQSRLKLKI